MKKCCLSSFQLHTVSIDKAITATADSAQLGLVMMFLFTKNDNKHLFKKSESFC